MKNNSNKEFYDHTAYDDGMVTKFVKRVLNRFEARELFVVLILITFIIGSVGINIYNHTSSGFEVEGIKFRYEQGSDEQWHFTDQDGHNLLAYTEVNALWQMPFSDKYIDYKGDVYALINEKEGDAIVEMFYEVNGDFVAEAPMFVFGSSKEVQLSMAEQLFTGTGKVISHVKGYDGFQLRMMVGLLALMGAAGVSYPEALWKMKYFLSVDGGEPTFLYIVSSRMGGAFLLLMAMFFPFVLMMM